MKHEYYVELRDGRDKPVGFRVVVDPVQIALWLSRRALKIGKATALSGAVVVHKAEYAQDTTAHDMPEPADAHTLAELPPSARPWYMTVPRAFNSGPRSAADVSPEPPADTLPSDTTRRADQRVAEEQTRATPAQLAGAAKQRLAQTKLERAQNRDQDRDDARVSAGTTKGRQRPGKPATIDAEPAIPYRWPSPADFADKEPATGRGWPKPGERERY